jgi:putative membrane protein
MKNIFPILVVIYILEFIILGIAPFDRATWFAENLPMVLIVLALVLTYRKFQFSNLSYIFMFVLIYLHTIGGHYTFANVPFGFVTDLF